MHRFSYHELTHSNQAFLEVFRQMDESSSIAAFNIAHLSYTTMMVSSQRLGITLSPKLAHTSVSWELPNSQERTLELWQLKRRLFYTPVSVPLWISGRKSGTTFNRPKLKTHQKIIVYILLKEVTCLRSQEKHFPNPVRKEANVSDALVKHLPNSKPLWYHTQPGTVLSFQIHW